MTQFDDIAVTLSGHIGEIEIQRPPHNFFDYSLIQQIADACLELDKDASCRVTILAAQGKAFCAGANFGSGNDDDKGSKDFTEDGFNSTVATLYREATRLFTIKKPIIGAIQGAAIGGGLGLALVPDFRIVAPEARFAANFAKLGIHHGFGTTVTLPRLIGVQAATDMLLTGRRINGEEALQLGLADKVVPLADLRDEARAFAAAIAENAPLAVQSIRATLRADLADAVAQATEHELIEQRWLRETADAEEGIRAVSERRPGNFQGK